MWASILCFLTTYSNVITAVFTALLVFVTGGLIGLGFLQDRTTRRQLRAYLGVDEISDAGRRHINFVNTEVGRVLETCGLLKNFGVTPAYDVQIATGIVLIRGEITDEYFEGAKFNLSHTLQPTQESYMVIHSEPGISENELHLYKHQQGGYKAYVFGIVKYKDTFRKTHHTQFCINVDYRNGPTNTPGWDLYKKYNYSD